MLNFLIFIFIIIFFFLQKEKRLIDITMHGVLYIDITFSVILHQILNSAICLLQPKQLFKTLIENTKINVYNI